MAPGNTAEYSAFVRHYSKELPFDQASMEELMRHLSIVHLDKNQVLMQEGQRHPYLYFLLNGAVRSYHLKDGVEAHNWFALENEMVGSLQNFKDLPAVETIVTVEACTMIAVNLRTARPTMYQNVCIANFFRAILEEYALFLQEKIYFSQLANAMDRYVVLLEQESHLLQRIPLTYIASYLGISRETLSRLRAK